MSTSQPYDDCIEHYYQRLANIQVIYYFKTIKSEIFFSMLCNIVNLRELPNVNLLYYHALVK